jgi:ribosomal subunit interface protein
MLSVLNTTIGEIMNIQVNTDRNIEGNAGLESYIESSLSERLERYKTTLTRIEVHLSDTNGGKVADDDKRCLLEARIANRQPIVVSHNADTIHQAIDGATDKLIRSLDSMVGKAKDKTTISDFIPEPEGQEDENDSFEN